MARKKVEDDIEEKEFEEEDEEGDEDFDDLEDDPDSDEETEVDEDEEKSPSEEETEVEDEEYQAEESAEGESGGDRMSGLAADVPVQVVAVLGKRSFNMQELMSFHVGQVIDLYRPANETVDLVVGGKLIAKGELVSIDGKLGVKILKLV